MKELQKIIHDARNGNEIPFNHFLENTFKKLKKQLLKLTNSESETNDIFIRAMQKFWEKFVIYEDEVPQNPEGYIYSMCKNLWLIEKRNPWNKIVIKDAIEETSDIEASFFRDHEQDDQHFLKQRSLMIALNSISSKCKQLIEIGMDKSTKLKDVMHQLGYSNYQAIVQAKYNCKKRLIKEVYKAYSELTKSKKS